MTRRWELDSNLDINADAPPICARLACSEPLCVVQPPRRHRAPSAPPRPNSGVHLLVHSTAHRLNCLRHACTRRLTRSKRQSRVDTRKAGSKARVACTATVVPGVNAASSRDGLRGQPQRRLRTPEASGTMFVYVPYNTESSRACGMRAAVCASSPGLVRPCSTC